MGGWAQKITSDPGKVKKSIRDFIQIKVPAIDYAEPDTSHVLVERPVRDNAYMSKSKKIEFYFDPSRRTNSIAVDEDSTIVNPNDFSVVEVEEEFRFEESDSTWIQIAEYYSIWDNKAVNPYGIDITKFSDTIKIALIDTALGRMWHAPVRDTYLTDDFGPRRYRWHYGVDLELDIGDTVYAVWDGIVRIVKYDHGGYGNYVLIRHYNGLETVYGHLKKQLVEVGEKVRAGDLIGWGGNTGRSSGPHLHFEVRYQGGAIDPQILWDFKNEQLRFAEFYLMPYHFDYLRNYRKTFYHKIRRGDTLLELSEKYHVPVRQILRLNRMTMRTPLRPGKKIRIR